MPANSQKEKQPIVSRQFSCSELKHGEKELLNVKSESFSQSDLEKQIKDSNLVGHIDLYFSRWNSKMLWLQSSFDIFIVKGYVFCYCAP